MPAQRPAFYAIIEEDYRHAIEERNPLFFLFYLFLIQPSRRPDAISQAL
jgi:hypothetical protein